MYWIQINFHPSRNKITSKCKISKRLITTLLTVNASGDIKIKPVMVYKYATPHSYNSYSLTVTRSISQTVCGTIIILAILLQLRSSSGSTKCFSQRLRSLVNRRILIFMSSCPKIMPQHTKFLADCHPNVQVQFLPLTPHLCCNHLAKS